MDPQVRYIPESEYREHFDQCLLELARAIAFSGLSISEIAKGARLKWDTVYAASQAKPVRMDNAERIRYFLEVHKRESRYDNEKEHTDNPAD